MKLGAAFRDCPNRSPGTVPALVTGVICGVRVEDIEDPVMQGIRYLDKLIDELAKGRPMEKILAKLEQARVGQRTIERVSPRSEARRVCGRAYLPATFRGRASTGPGEAIAEPPTKKPQLVNAHEPHS